jgi:hypothetical protein
MIVVARIQAKFYTDSELWADAQKVLDQQGCDYSEGISRLIQLLVQAPEELRPVLLNQAPGEAAAAIAEWIIEQRGKRVDTRHRLRSAASRPSRGLRIAEEK